MNHDHFSSLDQLHEEVFKATGEQSGNVVSEISDMGYMKGATTKICD